MKKMRLRPDSRAHSLVSYLRSGGGTGRILRNAGTQLSGQIVGAVLATVYLALSTRSLGMEEFGRLSIIVATAQTAATLVAFQCWQIVSRYGVRHLDDEDRLARLLWFCTGLDVVGGLLAAAASAVVCGFVARTAGWDPSTTLAGCLYCATTTSLMRSTPIGLLRIRQKYAIAAACDAIAPVARTIGAVAVWSMGGGLSALLCAWALGEVGVSLAYWVAAARSGAPWRRLSRPCARGVTADNPGIWRYAIATNASSALRSAGKSASVLIVAAAAGEAAAGAYRICLQLCFSISRWSLNVARAALPEFSLAGREDETTLRKVFMRTTTVSLGCSAACLPLIPFASGPVLRMVAGERYDAAAMVMAVLAVSALVELAATTFEPLLLSIGRAGAALRCGAVGTSTMLALLWPASAAYGAQGAAWAILAGTVAASASTGMLALRAMGWKACRTEIMRRHAEKALASAI
jgi:O-antigen/teichoic acid export membrane protein